MSEILAIEKLTTKFDTFERSTTAVDAIDLSLNQGEMLGVVGGTGSGKSVLLKSIINLVPFPGHITNGKVWFNGQDLLKLPEEKLQEVRGKEISLILSNPRTALNQLQTAGDQVAGVRSSHTNVTKQEAYKEALEMFRKVGIPDPERRMKAYPHELSGGMCQRVVIAMALINSPRVLLADELSSGLDVTVQRQILDLLSYLIQIYKSSTIIVTRDFGVVANYCNRVAVMFQGRIVEMDRVESFFDRACHPVTLQLLKSTFAAKGAKERSNPDENKNVKGEAELNLIYGELREVEDGHFVRVSE